ncbi:MAG: exosortase/archaeosortase family protein [Candidatus Acidiferrales bacterium]
MYAAKATATHSSALKFGGREFVFVLIALACVGLYWNSLKALVSLCLQGDSYSHILLIPFIVLYLVISERGRIFREVRSAIPVGAAAIAAGMLISYLANPRFYSNGAEHLSGTIIGLVFAWVGCFVACFGARAARSAIFPLSFLFLMIPPPESLLSPIVAALQHGSVEVSYLLFKLFRVPVFRHGVLLSVPGVTIEVAKECSSIRSSMALLITCILAARFYLRSFWKQIVFVAVSLPVSVIKNGIRITTLTLLSIYVNPGFLHGDLHRDGGFVFFLLALVILWPLLSILHRTETPALHGAGTAAPSGELAGG